MSAQKSTFDISFGLSVTLSGICDLSAVYEARLRRPRHNTALFWIIVDGRPVSPKRFDLVLNQMSFSDAPPLFLLSFRDMVNTDNLARTSDSKLIKTKDQSGEPRKHEEQLEGSPKSFSTESIVVNDPYLKVVLRLNFTDEQRAGYQARIPWTPVTRVGSPFPPKDRWICENAAGLAHWNREWKKRPLANTRVKDGKRPDIIQVEDQQINVIVKVDQSGIYYDQDTDEVVLVVHRNFIPHPPTLQRARELCAKANDERLTDRVPTHPTLKKQRNTNFWQRNDPGTLVQVGHTCGERRAPMLGFFEKPAQLEEGN